jgi:hypothetical protein
MLRSSQDSDTIRVCLAAITNALQPIAREADSQVGSRHYKYTDFPAIMRALQPLLIEHGCFITHHYAPGVTSHDADGLVPASGWIDEPVLWTRLTHIESGQYVESFVPYVLQDVTNPQKHGSAMTYAKRYGTANLFNVITSDMDDDGSAASSGGASNRDFRGTGGGEDEHGIKKVTAKFDSACPMCGEQIKGTEHHARSEAHAVAWKPGKPAVHWSCYEQWKRDQENADVDQRTNQGDE